MKDQLISVAAKTATVALIILVALVLYSQFGPSLPISVNQITTNKNDLFSVTGSGEVTAKPDIAEVSFGVSATGQTVAAVQNQSNEAINKVVAAVKALGIADKDIKTTNYNINPQYGGVGQDRIMSDPQGPLPPIVPDQNITGYSMNVNVVVKVRDLDKVNQVIDTATENGANQLGGISFTVDNPDKYQAEARKLAIEDAKKQANELASAAGIQLGKVVGVYESPMFYGRGDAALSAKAEPMGGPNVPTQIEPGSSTISTQVTLNYETR